MRFHAAYPENVVVGTSRTSPLFTGKYFSLCSHFDLPFRAVYISAAESAGNCRKQRIDKKTEILLMLLTGDCWLVLQERPQDRPEVGSRDSFLFAFSSASLCEQHHFLSIKHPSILQRDLSIKPSCSDAQNEAILTP